jgi:hypothetical protein
MKSSWVLSEEERYRRFRKHREKLQVQGGEEPREEGSSPPREDYYRDGEDSDEEGQRYPRPPHINYSPLSGHSSGGCETDTERKYHYGGQGSPSYLSPPPLSPLSAHNQVDIPYDSWLNVIA